MAQPMTTFGDLMRFGEPVSRWAHWTIGGVSAAVFVVGLWWHHAGLLGVGAVVLVALLRDWLARRNKSTPQRTGAKR